MSGALIIQSDFTAILEVSHPQFVEVKDEIIKFCEVQQANDLVYIFKLTDLSIWNAAALEISFKEILATLQKHSRYDIPQEVIYQINKWYDLFGIVELHKHEDNLLYVKFKDAKLLEKSLKDNKIKQYIHSEYEQGFLITDNFRGEIKSLLMKINIPVDDKIGFTEGFHVETKIIPRVHEDPRYCYQGPAAKAAFISGNSTIIGPCGCGKTIIGINLMGLCETSTLIVTNSQASVKQWKKTILALTNIPEEMVGTYDKKNKEIKPITITTYNMISFKYKGELIHFPKFRDYNFGLLILDEVHLMPAQMFRIVSSFQAVKRMALTATFVREDGREKDIFTLIGPKRYEKSWKDLEELGFIASVTLQEIRVPMDAETKDRYNHASNFKQKFKIAATSPSKLVAIKEIMKKHPDGKFLIIGEFTDNLIELGKKLDVPVVYGDTPNEVREEWYDKMRKGDINKLIASRVANAALDIPDISIVIQVSFQYGSRNEETQRVGRCTRPKDKPAYFYTLVSKDTKEENYNFNRQQFLTNEGYNYEIKEMAA